MLEEEEVGLVGGEKSEGWGAWEVTDWLDWGSYICLVDVKERRGTLPHFVVEFVVLLAEVEYRNVF